MTTSPSAATATARQLRLARGWRERLRADSTTSGGHLKVARRGDRPGASITLDAPHCADLFVKSNGAVDAARLVPRLGELPRLVHLATAPLVDPLVLNALWDDDALCAMGPSLCARCDEVDRRRVTPTVTLSIARGWQDGWRSGVGIIHDAIYVWQEATASAEFIQLRDALGSSTSDRPPVQLNLLLGLFEDDGDMVVRDLQTLVAHADSGQFRLARILPLMRAAQTKSPHYAPLHTAILDSGILTRPGPIIHHPATPEETQHAWQWLIDWAERANKPPPQVEAMTIVRRPGQTTELLTKLLRLVVTKSTTLGRLTLFWPLHLETDAEQRRRAAEAVGAALLAPQACVCLDKLELDLGDLSADDVAALQRGAEDSSRDDARDEDALPRFQSVKWKAPHTSEPFIDQFVQLLGTVGVCELEIAVGDRDLSCHTLKTVMQDCAATLTVLRWWGLGCDDAIELENATAWSNSPSQLRELRVFVRDGCDPNMLRAMDALLARVGCNLTSFEVAPFQGALTDRMAEIIVGRCPRLLALNVANANPQFYEHLTQAYDEGRCGISTLAAQAIPRGLDTGWSSLLEALQDATRGHTRNLRVLTLQTIWMEDHQSDDVFNTLIDTLSTNETLTRILLQGCISADAQKMLQALPHQFADRGPSLRRRLAFISVCDGHDDDKRLPKLPPDVLHVVFAFAGRRAPRYEYLF